MRRNCIISFILALLSASAAQEMTASALKAMGAPNNPLVEVAWNRYYDHSGIGDICRRLAQAHPGVVKLASIGASVQGRDLYVLTITNFNQGVADRKPAMYIDGNIHSNE
ncbi:peptidase M14, partial [candidate division KSB1 bacterium]|nr:peptidase M14 [candidate division KSB1 bacterium]